MKKKTNGLIKVLKQLKNTMNGDARPIDEIIQRLMEYDELKEEIEKWISGFEGISHKYDIYGL